MWNWNCASFSFITAVMYNLEMGVYLIIVFFFSRVR